MAVGRNYLITIGLIFFKTNILIFILISNFFTGDTSLTWCRLAYWEERARVGHQVGVSSRAVEVFSHQPRPSASPGHHSVCLESLYSLNPKPSQSTIRTQEKIGLGETMFLYSDYESHDK